MNERTKVATTETIQAVIDTTKAHIAAAVSAAYKPKGTVAFADLPPADAAHLNYMYNVSDSFTTTEDFTGGAGKEMPAGTDVSIINDGDDDAPVYKYNCLAGKTDLSAYQTKNIANETQGETTVEGALTALAKQKARYGAVSVAADSADVFMLISAYDIVDVTLTSEYSEKSGGRTYALGDGERVQFVRNGNSYAQNGFVVCRIDGSSYGLGRFGDITSENPNLHGLDAVHVLTPPELSSLQTKALESPIEVGGEEKHSVEEALGAVAGNLTTKIAQVTQLPEPTASIAGKIFQYVGGTAGGLVNGYFYECIESNEAYRWVQKAVQPASGQGLDVVTEMPDSPNDGQVVLYNGHSTTQYAHGGVYRYNNSQWEFLGALIQLVEVPFTLSLDSIQAISDGDTARVITFTASAESVPTEETIAGVTASGVIQGKVWGDLSGTLSQVDGTTFRVMLDGGVSDSLGQLAQFPEGSFVTIPAFSWVSGTTQYIHAAETVSVSETTVSQKLAFNTTGPLDSATQATRFNISSSYEIPFALTYSGLSTVAMKDSSYNQEVTQSWTPSIVAANDSTELIFTPSTPSALHGDNIAITAGTLTATANGVTYTYDFATDNLTLRWGNTSYDLGDYNNFASMTAAPTSANSGSVTCALTPQGPGATAYELAFMAELKPTVYIGGVECANVAWTQGEIVAGGASGVTTVGGKTIDVAWNADSHSDTDSYGIALTASVVSKTLSVACSYIEQAVTLSSPSPTIQNGVFAMGFTADFSLPDPLSLASSEYTASATGVLQANTKTVNADGAATYGGTAFTVSSFASGTDTYGQRVVFPSGYGSVTVSAFSVYHGDYHITHDAQTLTVAESPGIQHLDLGDPNVATWTCNGSSWTIRLNSNITRGARSDSDVRAAKATWTCLNGEQVSTFSYNISHLGSMEQVTTSPQYVIQLFNRGTFDWGTDITMNISSTIPESWVTKENPITAFGVSLDFGDQSFPVPAYRNSVSVSLDSALNCVSQSYDSGGSRHEFYVAPVAGASAVNGSRAAAYLTVSITTPLGTYNVDFGNYAASGMDWSIRSGTVPAALQDSGTITVSWPQFNDIYEVPNSEGFMVYTTATAANTLTGSHYYESYYDDDDCDDD